MRVGLWGLAAVFLGAFAAHFLLQDRGYVLINFLGYVIEMSVPGLLLALAAAYAGVRVVVALWQPRGAGSPGRRRSEAASPAPAAQPGAVVRLGRSGHRSLLDYPALPAARS